MSAKAAEEANDEAELSKVEKSVADYQTQLDAIGTVVSIPAAVDACCWLLLTAQVSENTDRINDLVPLVKEILDNAEDPEKLEEWQQDLYDELKTLQSYVAEDGGEIVKAEAVLLKTEQGADLIRRSPIGKRKRGQTAAGSTSTATTAAAPASDA
jgi:hypothetical protein